MRTFSTLTTIVLASLILSGCESSRSVEEGSQLAAPPTHTKSSHARHTNLDSQSPVTLRLTSYFEEWEGTPYRWGGASKSGIDCSAFTQKAYQTVFQHPLPRTTRQQLSSGDKISLSSANFGDLIFFKTGASRYHVGIYIGEKQFMHASSSKGVTISRVDNPYWSARLIQVRRYPLQ